MDPILGTVQHFPDRQFCPPSQFNIRKAEGSQGCLSSSPTIYTADNVNPCTPPGRTFLDEEGDTPVSESLAESVMKRRRKGIYFYRPLVWKSSPAGGNAVVISSKENDDEMEDKEECFCGSTFNDLASEICTTSAFGSPLKYTVANSYFYLMRSPADRNDGVLSLDEEPLIKKPLLAYPKFSTSGLKTPFEHNRPKMESLRPIIPSPSLSDQIAVPSVRPQAQLYEAAEDTINPAPPAVCRH
ncbi:hypothetical protein LOZ51_002821 [Ophidiomyces ophidiicola]|nr:hypothetical protein LOZ55_003718 [Ophidiomyces ophidiicola]KAI1994005.1 hypothetical protein LOZ54_001192 [Ophidiomyces ophidiicola]KAI1998144.1 hypothetical protein LOZ51_002821 [Ophidiomyces ophidiicola]